MNDEPVRHHLGRVFDEKGRQHLLAHFRQVRGVGRVIAAHHDEQVHRFLQHLFQRVLPVLGRAANRVEETEMLGQIPGAVLLFHRAPDPALDFLCLAAEHRRLIRNADGLQMDVRVKTRRVSAFELFQKLLLLAAIQNVVADAIRLGEIINDQVMAGAVRGRLRGRGLRFLVLGFAVNDAGDRFLRVLADPFPHAHHVTTRRVHHDAAFFLKLFPRADLGAKRGNNDHVLRAQP